jgi:hypothetical protein
MDTKDHTGIWRPHTGARVTPEDTRGHTGDTGATLGYRAARGTGTIPGTLGATYEMRGHTRNKGINSVVRWPPQYTGVTPV